MFTHPLLQTVPTREGGWGRDEVPRVLGKCGTGTRSDRGLSRPDHRLPSRRSTSSDEDPPRLCSFRLTWGLKASTLRSQKSSLHTNNLWRPRSSSPLRRHIPFTTPGLLSPTQDWRGLTTLKTPFDRDRSWGVGLLPLSPGPPSSLPLSVRVPTVITTTSTITIDCT